jgi:hypothetical protein
MKTALFWVSMLSVIATAELSNEEDTEIAT